MTKQMKREWLAALRSGKYRQTKGQLHNGVGFCCLGVLLDACVVGDWVPATSEERDSMNDAPSRLPWAFVSSTGRTRPSAETSQEFGYLIGSDDIQELIKMNDDGTRFPAIADWIEANVEAA